MRYERHGLSAHPTYKVWLSMKDRCFNPRNVKYSYYGGRGISVCDRWRESFPAFLQDMGEPPTGYSIDRINNEGHYEPSNCRWTTPREQMMNRRNTVFVTVAGVQYKAGLLAKLSGLKMDTIVARANKCATMEELLDPKRRVFYEGLAMSPNFGKTHCKHGHEFTKENTYVYLGKYRQCITCNRARTKAARRNK